MLLYKYVNFQDGLNIVKHRRIKVQKIVNFNDPFEMLENISSSASDEYKRIIRGLWEDFHKYCRVSCFCVLDMDKENDQRNDIVMWSHYAQKHEGLRIRFLIEESSPSQGYTIKKVDYREERVKDSSDVQDNPNASWNEVLRPIVKNVHDVKYVKSKAWEYENEWRLVMDANRCKSDGENFYCEIKDDNIFGIDFGCRCPSENVLAVAGYIGQAGLKDVVLKRADIDQNEFKMNYRLLKDYR